MQRPMLKLKTNSTSLPTGMHTCWGPLFVCVLKMRLEGIPPNCWTRLGTQWTAFQHIRAWRGWCGLSSDPIGEVDLGGTSSWFYLIDFHAHLRAFTLFRWYLHGGEGWRHKPHHSTDCLIIGLWRMWAPKCSRTRWPWDRSSVMSGPLGSHLVCWCQPNYDRLCK